jgi:heme/copper-type cytochrome/quinol oxidase subunit 2
LTLSRLVQLFPPDAGIYQQQDKVLPVTLVVGVVIVASVIFLFVAISVKVGSKIWRVNSEFNYMDVSVYKRPA